MPNFFNSTQTSKPELLNQVKPLFKDIMNDAQKYYSKGPYSYNKSLVSPFAQSSRNAFTGMKDLAAANSGGNGMAPHLQSIMSNGGFNPGQMDSMSSLRDLTNNKFMNDLINGNGLTQDQNLVADRYRTQMNTPFDLNANPAYAQVRQSALDAGAQAVTGQAAKMGRFGGGANQNILSRNQMETAGTMDYGEYRNWQDQTNQAAGNLANLSGVGVNQHGAAVDRKAGLESTLFNMGQAGLSNMGQAYDTAMQPFYTQRAVGQEYENKRQQLIDDKMRRFNEQNPFTHIANYLSLANGSPRGETQTMQPSPAQLAFGGGTGLLATMSAMRNWGTPTSQAPQGSYGTGFW